jgi:hypothetical protein
METDERNLKIKGNLTGEVGIKAWVKYIKPEPLQHIGFT